MDDIIELSSDYSAPSSPLETKTNSEVEEHEAFDVDSILLKYSNTNFLEKYGISNNDTTKSKATNSNINDRLEENSNTNILYMGTTINSPSKLIPNNHENVPLTKPRKYTKKQVDNDKIKSAQDKVIKQSLAKEIKNIKPGECMKFINVFIDESIMTESYSVNVAETLNKGGLSYKIVEQLFPYTITWTRTQQTHLSTADGELSIQSDDIQIKEVILVMKYQQFIDHIHNKTLISYMQSIQSQLSNTNIFLIIFGLQQYFKLIKKHKQIKLDNACRGIDNEKDFYNNSPAVSKEDIEMSLTDLQLTCGCSHRILDSAQDVASTIFQFSKAIAETPYKLQKYEKEQQSSSYVSAENRDCVKIDKNGNGLNRLWQQQLTLFPMAGLETAEAIKSKFPTPLSLIEAYKQCSAQDGERLLQDLNVRRAAGPLTALRKIGPELSKKMYTFFTSTDGNITIN